ncbi:hypothetical protein [Macellibacteroides fermentans]|uniref:Uncharacterized protein n=1 Tax=Macellibacteroides fermentans TaxID=879969 RepID=A0A8E2A3B0_9PORP|nr:hypothetical protein [Macellibacteroides fermentans]NYI50785.1 hypothetical protein [Macellibacteroides fermentans]
MKRKSKDSLKFYSIICLEFLLLPFLMLKEILKKWVSNLNINTNTGKERLSVTSDTIDVLVHEWGGYNLNRVKKHKSGREFNCGLKPWLEFLKNYTGKHRLNITLSVSEIEKFKHLNEITPYVNSVIPVSNSGYDFSGYSSFIESIKDSENKYIILSNSSVNTNCENFIDGYIDYMEKNPDVAMMGTSYCTKCYQSLIRNNFRPHIQSFFILTTIDVMKEIVRNNSQLFPGKNITHKLLLIRKGEIRMSEIALKLGYSLAIVLENGSVFKYKKKNKWDNCYSQWSYLKKGDMRFNVSFPNKINPISL